MTTNETSGMTSPVHIDADTVAAMLRAGEPLPQATIVVDRPIRI